MTTVPTTLRSDRPLLRDVGWRAALVVLAAVAAVTGLPAWGRAPLAVAAAVATGAFFVARYRRRGLIDAVLTAVGGGVIALALLGFVLNLLPWGLTTAAWAIGAGAFELVALTVLAVTRRPVRPHALRPSRAALGWGVGVAAVLAGAIVLSVVSFSTTHVPPLAMSATRSGAATVVTVSAGREQGPFRLDLVTTRGRSVVARDLRVGPDGGTTARITVPAGTRGLLQLVPAGASEPVRELILDTTGAAR